MNFVYSHALGNKSTVNARRTTSVRNVNNAEREREREKIKSFQYTIQFKKFATSNVSNNCNEGIHVSVKRHTCCSSIKKKVELSLSFLDKKKIIELNKKNVFSSFVAKYGLMNACL